MKIKASGTDALILYADILKFSYKFVKHVHKSFKISIRSIGYSCIKYIGRLF